MAALKLVARPDVAACLRKLAGGKRLEESTIKAIRHASAVGLITVDGSQPGHLLRAGQALKRAWLQATALGLALHPMITTLYMFEMLNRAVASIFTSSEQAELRALSTQFKQLFPQARGQSQVMLFRLSVAAPPSERSLRYPLGQVLSFGAPNNVMSIVHSGEKINATLK